jgi:hypothetical protein
MHRKAVFGLAEGSTLQLRSLFWWLYIYNAQERKELAHGGESFFRMARNRSGFGHSCRSNLPKAVHGQYNSRESVLKKEIPIEVSLLARQAQMNAIPFCDKYAQEAL